LFGDIKERSVAMGQGKGIGDVLYIFRSINSSVLRSREVEVPPATVLDSPPSSADMRRL
jgi:hypothetical protein